MPNQSNMDIFLTIWSSDQFEILQGGIVQTETVELLLFVTSTPPTHHQGKQHYVQWKNTHTASTARLLVAQCEHLPYHG